MACAYSWGAEQFPPSGDRAYPCDYQPVVLSSSVLPVFYSAVNDWLFLLLVMKPVSFELGISHISLDVNEFETTVVVTRLYYEAAAKDRFKSI